MNGKVKLSSGKADSTASAVNEINAGGLDIDALLGTSGTSTDHDSTPAKSWNCGDIPLTLSNLATALIAPPDPPKVIIDGILRQGHKMMVTGPSKAGKTWLMIELACAIATGKPWFGSIPVKRGKVLYLNMELSEGSFINRFKTTTEALSVSTADQANIDFLNLRGLNISFSDLAQIIAEMVKVNGYTMVILDPIYKLFEGSENDQQDVTMFCSNLDVIATAGASVVYTHHHSKGAQANRAALDRGSGSGVFGRDVDAHMDMLEVDCAERSDLINILEGKESEDSKTASAYRVEWTLREFKPRPVSGLWFEFPIHRFDNTGTVANAKPKTGKREGGKTRADQLQRGYNERTTEFVKLFSEGVNSLKEMSARLKVTSKTIRTYAKDLGYQVKGDAITQE